MKTSLLVAIGLVALGSSAVALAGGITIESTKSGETAELHCEFLTDRVLQKDVPLDLTSPVAFTNEIKSAGYTCSGSTSQGGSVDPSTGQYSWGINVKLTLPGGQQIFRQVSAPVGDFQYTQHDGLSSIDSSGNWFNCSCAVVLSKSK